MTAPPPGIILTVAEMAAADRAALAAGVPSLTLMENAGRAVASAIAARWSPRPAAVLCGPGNNGGDGYVVARILTAWGWPVTVFALGAPASADARAMAARWTGRTEAFTAFDGDWGLIVDALFGAGLSRPLEDEVAMIALGAESGGAEAPPVVAVDVPSGVPGDGGAAGPSFRAALTVTFAAKKPAHVLYPGRGRCGEIVVADIGIPATALHQAAALHENAPALWRERLPPVAPDGHKYDRGHVVSVSGPMASTGAARLAARAALRIGAGLVTVASPPDALLVNACHLTAIMLRAIDGPEGLAALLTDRRLNAVVMGPGLGVGARTRDLVAAAAAGKAALVLDADALTGFAGAAEALAGLLHRKCVLTPHAGEFERLCPGLLAAARNRIEAAREAARRLGAVMVLKGADTVVADPLGAAVVNTNAPPDLATAGAGDVLAGMIAGLLARGMPPFHAACAAVWMHGAAGQAVGPGLIAEDLPEALPGVWRALTPGRS